MLLMYKQLSRQLCRNKVFVALLLLLTVLTSLSFFFVIFSIDGNMAALNELSVLTENQLLYRSALESNNSLAYMFIASATGLTAFVFLMFFYRFFRAGKRQIGCLKALGFKDNPMRFCFVAFTAVLSVIGAVLGLVGGYFLSDVLLGANMQTYQLTGLVKEASPYSLAVGLGVPAIIFCITAFFCYSFVRGKEPGVLIAGNLNQARFSVLLMVANSICRIIPARNKFPLRIALRKPLAVFLVIVAVMTFKVFIILGQSIYMSGANHASAIINQTIGIIVGVILIFLALYVNFQDNTRDMLILHMMGYKAKDIRKLLIDVYMPIVWAAFLLTLYPSILVASSIQRAQSIAANEHMPFSTNVIVILAAFAALNVIYWLVQSVFGLGIRRTIAKEDMAGFVYAE